MINLSKINTASCILDNKLLGKVCIVTGASEGIGEAIARHLSLKSGATVVLAGRQLEKLTNLSSELHFKENVPEERLMVVKCDVTSLEDVKKLVEQTLELFRRIDVLVNCAGCMYYCMIKNGYTEVNNNTRKREKILIKF